MDHKEFQKLAVRTESLVDKAVLSDNDFYILQNTLYSLHNVCEVLDCYKKHIFYKKPLDKEKINVNLNSNVMNSSESLAELFKTLREDFDAPIHSLDVNVRVFHALLGTVTEHGELAVPLANYIQDGSIDLVNIVEEIGDSDWYKALFFESTGISWDDVQQMIIKKLEVRYADKIFSEEEANGRDLESERQLLVDSIGDQVQDYLDRQMKLDL